jgi:hypothetical protein
MKMNKVFTILLFLILPFFIYGQTKHKRKKENNTLTICVYDSNGNVTYYQQKYNHKPTEQDVILFHKQIDSLFMRKEN